MKSKIFISFFIILILTVMALVGCYPSVPSPDLVPANPPGMSGYCNVDDSNNLIIYVKNQGDADAPASLVKVQFYLASGLQEFSSAIVAIPAGETKSVSFAIPSGCFNPDCNFIITVDSGEGISESSELNNTVDNGTCIG
jgi:subtilase family serine protease